MRIVSALLVGGLTMFCLCTNIAFALPSQWQFKTLRSEHFDVIYRTDQRELANLYMKAAEDSYSLLFPLFQEAPSRTVIVIRDDTDLANGLATFLPYPLIIVNPVLPGAGQSIGDYGDWAFEIVLHEYTHILNMHPSHGFYTPLKWIFGAVIRPNGILPRWYLEGLAVETESRYSTFGRLRSPEFGAQFRAMNEGKKFDEESIDRVNEVEIPNWPYGNRPYLLGSAWWTVAAQDPSVIYDLNQRFSRRLPFMLNAPVKERLKMDVEGVLTAAYKDIRAKTDSQFQVIDMSGGEHLAKIEGDESKGQFLPTISPDGLHLIFLGTIYKKAAEVRLVSRAKASDPFDFKTATTIEKTIGTNRFSWLPNSAAIVFDQIDSDRPHVEFSDLYLHNLGGKTERLSLGLRATEPSVSPLGDRVAFIRYTGGRNLLSVMNLKTHKHQTLYKAAALERLVQPVFQADQILFISRNVHGDDTLMSYQLATKKVATVAQPVRALKFMNSADSQALLIGSAQTGATNVYWWKPGHAPRPITNVKTAVSGAAWDEGRKELIVSRLTGEGGRLFLQAGNETTRPPQLNPLFDLPEPTARPATTPPVEELGYQPLRYLLPRYWIPAIYPIERGILFQGQTFNTDPVGRNAYMLSGSYDTVTSKGGYSIDYTNSSLPTDIELYHSLYQSYLGASDLTLENQTIGMNLGFFPSGRSKYWHADFGGNWTQTSTPGFALRRLGPAASIGYSRLDDPFSNWGWAFNLKHHEYLKQDGYVDYGISTGLLALRSKAPFFKSHQISAQIRGAVAPKMPFGTVIALGERNLGANYLVNLTGSDFLLRGYASGTFIGRKVVNGNFEYKFPLGDVYKGSGTMPLFFKSLEGVLFYDTMAVDGAAFRVDDNPAAQGYYRSRMREFYSGTGGELRLNLTAAYHLPVTITAGFYYGLKEQYGGGFTQFFGISYDGLGALGN
jgi:hypothetical protein